MPLNIGEPLCHVARHESGKIFFLYFAFEKQGACLTLEVCDMKENIISDITQNIG